MLGKEVIDPGVLALRKWRENFRGGFADAYSRFRMGVNGAGCRSPFGWFVRFGGHEKSVALYHHRCNIVLLAISSRRIFLYFANIRYEMALDTYGSN